MPSAAKYEQIDAPMSCQGPSGSGSARRSVICSARCSALVRDRPMVVMTLRWPRRSRMSQVRPGGCARVLVEPVSISTLTAGMACFLGFSGRCSGRFCWDADKTGTGRSGVEGKLLLGHAASRQADGAGDGRRIVRRPAGAAADYRVRPSPGQVGVSGRRGGGGSSRGRRTLEAADDFRLGFSFCGAAFDVAAGGRVRAHAGEHDPPQGVVGLAVAAGVEAVADGLAGGCRDGRGGAQVRPAASLRSRSGWSPAAMSSSAAVLGPIP